MFAANIKICTNKDYGKVEHIPVNQERLEHPDKVENTMVLYITVYNYLLLWVPVPK